MHTWSKSPLWKFAISLSIGIAFGSHFELVFLIPIAVLLLSLSFLEARNLSSKFIFLFFFLWGYLIAGNSAKPRPKLELPKEEQSFVFRVMEMPYEKSEHYMINAEIIPCSEDGFSGKLQIQADNTWNQLKAGQVAGGRGKLKAFSGAFSPGEFDYAAYMDSQGYIAQWQASSEPKLIKDNPTWRERILRFRHELLHRLPMHEESGRLIAALVLGWKAELDKSTKESFRHSGVMHVLAVSGLHVGLVMLLVQFITHFLRRNKVLSLLRYIIILCSIWFYAMLSGGSDSVLRSACMCSFIGLSVLLNRKTSGLNLLGAAALVLLCISPKSLFQPGFQLSFVAVAGLILYQPARIIRKRHYALEYIVNASRTSIVAQVWTSALAVFYFKSLPAYFLIGNLIILPIATMLLYLGIASISFHSVPYISEILSAVSEALAKSMLYLAHQVSELPYSEIQFTDFDWHWLLIILLSLIFLGDFFKLRRPSPLLWILFLVFLGSSVDLITTTPQDYELLFSKESYQYTNLISRSNRVQIEFKTPAKIDSTALNGIHHDDQSYLEYKVMGGLKIVQVHHWKSPKFSRNLPCDVLFLAGPYPNLKTWKELQNCFQPRIVILHQSYNHDRAEEWKSIIANRVPCYALEEGWIGLHYNPQRKELSLPHEDH